MSERYSRLFSLPENLYAEGAPVIIAAGALLKDNQTGNVLAQLKLQNIENQTIKAATVHIFPMDTAGDAIDETITYQYLDVSAERDAFSGQKVAIPIPNAAARSISVEVIEAIFSDNTKWTAKGEKWSPLKKPTLVDHWQDSELVRQFHLDYGPNSNCLLSEDRDLWICVCGAINHSTESRCHSCTQSLNQLKEFNLDDLRKKRDERLEIEKAEAQKRYLAKEKVIRRNARVAKKVAIAFVAVAIACIIARFVADSIQKNNAYQTAVSLMEQKKYEEAIDAFTALGNYKDSDNQIKDCAYQIAVSLMEQEKFGEAIDAFTALGNYKDSAKQIEAANQLLALEKDYQNAIQLLNSDDYVDNNEAYGILSKLGSYKDATELLKRFVYRVISEEDSGSKTVLNNGTITFLYDDYGRLILKEGPSWSHVYAYDDNGNLIKDGSPDFQTEYQYGSNSKLISARKPIMRETSGKITKTTYLNITYDESGYPLMRKISNSGPCWVYEYQGKGETLHDSVRITVTYNEHEYSIDLSGYDSNKLCEGAIQPFPTFWIVNADGKQTSSYELTLDAETGIYETPVENCEYDAQMNLIKKITFDRYGKQVYEYHYANTYDDTGNLIKVERQTVGETGKQVREFQYGYIYAPNAS